MRTARVAAIGSLVVVCLSPQVTAQTPAKPDFTGTWIMDVEKSDLGPVPAPKVHTLTIVHKEPNISVARVIDALNDSSAFRTDGVSATSDSSCCGQVTTTGRWDGTTLQRRVVGAGFTQADVWTLSAEKLLTIVRDVEQGEASFKIRLAFNKKG